MANQLMVVAHPDDESIFGGALLLREQGWKVICVTNGDNAVRRREFKAATAFAQAEYEIWNYEDRYNGDFDRKKLSADIQRVLNETNYTKIVTHGLKGEYGHPQHIALSEVMHGLVKSNLYTFKLSDQILDLNLLLRKLKLLRCYRTQNIETYNKYVIFEGLEKATNQPSI
ncbi:PIG-L family deacetylase [Cohnella yongneupensis]|uniref:PIG-L family deacetylase n=1 Tax=Cohnella yongneupensis TaxID=425006 RepID=A0ABW0R695_9BACL